MQKKLLLALALLLVSASSMASWKTTIELKNGDKDEYLLSDKPLLTYSGKFVTLKSEKAEVSYEMVHIAKQYFTEYETITDIRPLISDPDQRFLFYFIDQETLIIKGAKRADVYSMSGQKMSSVVAEGEYMEVSLSGCAAGIYVITTDVKQIKVLKK